MDLKQLFINSAGRLRSGWRLVLFVLIFIAGLFLTIWAGRVFYFLLTTLGLFQTVPRLLADLVDRLILLIPTLAAAYICTRWIEGLPWRAIGLTLHSGWLRDLIVGSVIGIISLAVATAIAMAGGGLRFSLLSSGTLPQIARTLVFSAGLFIVAALAEEALFRGYPLQTLTRAKLVWFGVFLTSIAFASVHIRNPNFETGLAFANLIFAGVWLGVAYLRTRSLWFPLGVHWAWNWALGSLFGLPVSGITEIAPHPLLQGTDLGPAWLTGGSYGIEGGVACTITLFFSTIFIWRTKLVSATEDMRLLTSQENPAKVNLVLPSLPQTNSPAVE